MMMIIPFLLIDPLTRSHSAATCNERLTKLCLEPSIHPILSVTTVLCHTVSQFFPFFRGVRQSSLWMSVSMSPYSFMFPFGSLAWGM